MIPFMLVLPAIDLKQGRCVRLLQGRADAETVYGDDPVAVARDFAARGARMLHLVNLDGAFGDDAGAAAANLAVIGRIRDAVSLPLELGGGLRSAADIDQALGLGVDSVIVGTLAVREPEALEAALARHGGERVQLGVDAREGRVAVAGWREATDADAVDFGRAWRARGVTRAVFTDIARDGMMGGPNVAAIRRFAEGTGLRVTASGGVASPADLERLALLEPLGVDRVIVGKAIYEGKVSVGAVAAC